MSPHSWKIMSTGWGIKVILALPMIERGPNILIYLWDHFQHKDHFSELDIQIKIVTRLSYIDEKNSSSGRVTWHFNGLMQERCNSIADALELRLSCIDPSICVLKWPLETQLILLSLTRNVWASLNWQRFCPHQVGHRQPARSRHGCPGTNDRNTWMP